MTKKEGCIVYRFNTPSKPARTVYVNLIKEFACTNDCLFCARPKSPEERTSDASTVYERKANANLLLERSPTVDEAMAELMREINEEDEEVAFVGLGEPLIYLPTIVELVQKIKANHDVRVRVDTNGLACCLHKDVVKKLESAGLDEIRISLNATDREEYERLCRPRFENAYDKLLGFIADCKKSSIDTHVSFVVGFNHEHAPTRTKEEYLAYAKKLGLSEENIIFRDYFS